MTDTTFTYDENLYSDFYKDAYGHRPRGDRFYHPDTTPEEKQEMWDWVLKMSEEAFKREQEAEERAAVEFEELITKTISLGAGDRETAIRWISETFSDWDRTSGYIVYYYNLPWSYKSELQSILD